MATIKGQSGLIKAGNTSVAEVRSFSVNQTATLEDNTGIEQEWKEFFVTNTEWAAQVFIFWDDANISLFPLGSTVSVVFYPFYDNDDNSRYFGDGIIISRQITGQFDTMVEANISILGVGDLTQIINLDPYFNNLEQENNSNLLLEDYRLILLE